MDNKEIATRFPSPEHAKLFAAHKKKWMPVTAALDIIQRSLPDETFLHYITILRHLKTDPNGFGFAQRTPGNHWRVQPGRLLEWLDQLQPAIVKDLRRIRRWQKVVGGDRRQSSAPSSTASDATASSTSNTASELST